MARLDDDDSIGDSDSVGQSGSRSGQGFSNERIDRRANRFARAQMSVSYDFQRRRKEDAQRQVRELVAEGWDQGEAVSSTSKKFGVSERDIEDGL